MKHPHNKQRPEIRALSLRMLSDKFLTVLLLAVAACLMIYSQIDKEQTNIVQNQVLETFAPAIDIASRPVSTLSDKINDITHSREIRAENIQLKAENEKLRQWYETALHLRAENKSLRDFLNVQIPEDKSFVTTRIIGDPGGNFVKTVLIPIGQSENIQKGHVVSTDKGMIGRIIQVSDSAARVLLITDLNSNIPVMVQNTLHRGILSGDNKNLMTLKRLPTDIRVEPGARIVTSGYGGVFPPNIPVGVVSSVNKDTIHVKPLSDLKDITYVQVIKTDINPVLESGQLSQ